MIVLFNCSLIESMTEIMFLDNTFIFSCKYKYSRSDNILTTLAKIFFVTIL